MYKLNCMSSQPNNASKSTVSNGSTPLARSSSSTQNSGSHIFPILEGLAKTHAMSPDMIGPNGDGCHSTLGYQPEMLKQLASNTLELKYCLVGNDPETINRIVESHWNRVVNGLRSLNASDRHDQITLLFKLAFFCRAIRCQGGRSRVQFYAMFKKLRTEFPSEALSLVSLIPHYGCFQDIDQLVTDFNLIGDKEMSRSLLGVYVDFLTEDLSRLLGSSLTMMSLGDIHTKIDTLNKELKKMTTSELSHFVGSLPTGQFSLAAKWLKREGKKNSSHRDDLICLMFPTINRTMLKSMEYGRMVLRKCTTALSQCLNVVEQYMTEVIPTRSWGKINFKNVPSVATTKYRLAFANKTKEGLERSEREDRRMCAQNILTAVMDGKINGAQSDLKVLADLIWSQVDSDLSMSDDEIALVNCQWTKMVEFVNQLIEETLERDRLLRQEAIDAGDTVPAPIRDPRAVIPVVDVSGSMSGANVMQYAIAMGIVCGTISSIPGKLITFSEKPEVFSFDPKADIFDIFRKIKGCKWGYNTNLDATYKLLLGEMTAARDSGKSISTDFSTLIVTDGGFDHMVCYEPQLNQRDRNSYSSFQQRQEVAFTQAGFGVPLIVYWNLACRNAGFPAQSSTVGVKLVAGFSQTVMVEVMTGDYSTTIDETTGAVKVAVTPLDSFMKTMSHNSFDPIRDALDAFWKIPKTPVYAKIYPEDVTPVQTADKKTTDKKHDMENKSYDEIIFDLEQKIEVATNRKEDELKICKIEKLTAQLLELEDI